MLNEDEKKRIFMTMDCEKKRYYVYALCTEDGPFYIGKGTAERVMQHLEAANLAEESIKSDVTLSEEECKERIGMLSKKIKTILDNKKEITHVIIKWGLTDYEAFMCESSLINLLNFKLFEGKKIQPLTNIVNGHASEPEKNSVANVKTCARTLEQFLNECAIPEKSVSSLTEPYLFIKLNDISECINNNGSLIPQKIKEKARGTWPIDKRRCDKCKYVFILYEGRVVGIFKRGRISDTLDKEYDANKKSLPDDFPTFPQKGREMDQWVARFATVEEAESELTEEEYERFMTPLSNKKYSNGEEKEPNIALKDWRNRHYFVFEDDVPENLKVFLNCIVTKDDDKEYFKQQNSIRYLNC